MSFLDFEAQLGGTRLTKGMPTRYISRISRRVYPEPCPAKSQTEGSGERSRRIEGLVEGLEMTTVDNPFPNMSFRTP